MVLARLFSPVHKGKATYRVKHENYPMSRMVARLFYTLDKCNYSGKHDYGKHD